jgi:hypothetical protein
VRSALDQQVGEFSRLAAGLGALQAGYPGLDLIKGVIGRCRVVH